MKIEGLFDIRVVDNSEQQSRELQLSFTVSFQALDHKSQIDTFRSYIIKLKKDIESTDHQPTQQGMTTILQIAEELLPHLESDDFPLEETIVIEMGPASPLDQLLDKATLK